MLKEELKFENSTVLEGMTSISALIKAKEEQINDREIIKILVDKSKIYKNARQLSFLKAKRKELLDAEKDTSDDTYIPTLEDILDDASYWFDEENREYFNSWGVTDNYNADNAIWLTLGENIEIK